MTKIWTDGAYSFKRNQGGIGILIKKNDKEIYRFSKKFNDTTNILMELFAVIYAIKLVKPDDSIELFSDSNYVIYALNNNIVYDKYKKYWNILRSLIKNLNCDIKFTWVKGHSDCVENQIVDSLAVNASHRL